MQTKNPVYVPDSAANSRQKKLGQGMVETETELKGDWMLDLRPIHATHTSYRTDMPQNSCLFL